MRRRGPALLAAHIRSFDPGTPTARERVAAALGEAFTRELLVALVSSPGDPKVIGAETFLREGRTSKHNCRGGT